MPWEQKLCEMLIENSRKKLVEWVIHVKKKKQFENGLKDKTGKFQTVFTRSMMSFVIVKFQ